MMHAHYQAGAAVTNPKNFSSFQSYERELLSVVNGGKAEAKNQAAGLQLIENRLIASGARRSYAPLN